MVYKPSGVLSWIFSDDSMLVQHKIKSITVRTKVGVLNAEALTDEHIFFTSKALEDTTLIKPGEPCPIIDDNRG